MGWFLYNDNTANLIPYIMFSFLEDIPHPIPQVFNLGRLISQKHSNKDTN